MAALCSCTRTPAISAGARACSAPTKREHAACTPLRSSAKTWLGLGLVLVLGLGLGLGLG